jgi:hypothetical protein
LHFGRDNAEFSTWSNLRGYGIESGRKRLTDNTTFFYSGVIHGNGLKLWSNSSHVW